MHDLVVRDPDSEKRLRDGLVHVIRINKTTLFVEGLASAMVESYRAIAQKESADPGVEVVLLEAVELRSDGRLYPVRVSRGNRVTWEEFEAGRWRASSEGIVPIYFINPNPVPDGPVHITQLVDDVPIEHYVHSRESLKQWAAEQVRSGPMEHFLKTRECACGLPVGETRPIDRRWFMDNLPEWILSG